MIRLLKESWTQIKCEDKYKIQEESLTPFPTTLTVDLSKQGLIIFNNIQSNIILTLIFYKRNFSYSSQKLYGDLSIYSWIIARPDTALS